MRRFPYIRYYMDERCFAAWTKYKRDHDQQGALLQEAYYQHYGQDFKMLARAMEEGRYPASIGTFDKLNERGEQLKRYGDLSYYHRANVPQDGNRTFRDVDDADQFTSLFTGTKSVLMKKPWLEIDENTDKNIW